MKFAISIFLTGVLMTMVVPAVAAPKSKLERQCEDKTPATAIPACTRIIDSRRTDRDDRAFAHVSRGDAFRLQRRFKEAMKDYQAAHALSEQLMNIELFHMTALAAGEMALETKNYLVAAFMFQAAYDEDDKDKERQALVKFLGGVSAANIEQFDIAIESFDEAIKLSPSYANAYRERGAVQLLKQNHQAALSDLSRAIGLNPDDPKALRFRARAYIESGDRERAKSDLVKAVEIAPDDEGSRKALANFEEVERKR